MSSSRFQEGVWDADLREAQRHRQRRTRPRTALLVVVIVIFAVVGVLAYYFVFEETFGKGSGLSYQIKFSPVGSSHAGHAYIVNLSYSASTGLATGMTRLYIETSSGSFLANATPPSNCWAGNNFNACLAAFGTSQGWIVVLLTLAADTLSVYPTSAGGNAWSQTFVDFSTGGSIAVLSNVPLTGTGDTLHVVSGGSSQVSGSYQF
jgi:hypothetical protein